METFFLGIQAVEFDILFALQNLHCSWLNVLMRIFTELGNNGIIWILAGVGCICFKKSRRCGILMLLTMAVCFILGNGLIKNLVARPRPFQSIDREIILLIPPPGEFSFPSGHTLHSFAAAVMIFLHNKKVGVAAIALTALIALSRLYFFVHFPTDVLAGLVLGTLAALLVYRVAQRVKPAET